MFSFNLFYFIFYLLISERTAVYSDVDFFPINIFLVSLTTNLIAIRIF